VPVNFDPAATAAGGQVTVLATYRKPGGAQGGTGDESVPLTLPPTAPQADVALVCQQLASCVLLADVPLAPTYLWLLRVYRGASPDAVYRREPSQPLSRWKRLYGTDYGDLSAARPPCLHPFCTADSRVAAGSSACS